MALDGPDRERVYDLFEKAVQDYICESPRRFAASAASAALGGVGRRRCSQRTVFV